MMRAASLLGRSESGQSFELKLEGLIGSAFVLVEDERICAHPERNGEPSQRLERGLRRAGLVAA